MASIALKRPADTSQARGFEGTPSRGQCSMAEANASCNASSARSKSPSTRIKVARTRRDSARYVASICSRTDWDEFGVSVVIMTHKLHEYIFRIRFGFAVSHKRDMDVGEPRFS
jgi:hypothetical protein